MNRFFTFLKQWRFLGAGTARKMVVQPADCIDKPPFPRLIRDEYFWSGTIQLESWKGFAALDQIWELREPATEDNPKEGLGLEVTPATKSSLEPTAEQAAAFQHLLDHEQTIRDTVLQGIFEVYSQWRESYFGPISIDGGKTYRPITEFPELYHPEKMPEISSPNELARLIRPDTVHVLAQSIDGFTRIGFSFACKWDEEHGLGVLTHKGKVVAVGDGTEAFDHP